MRSYGPPKRKRRQHDGVVASETVFDDVERDDPTHGRFAETTFEILNRAPGPYWGRVRDLAEEWFARLCAEGQAHVRSRLRARDDRQFRAGFWELYCHESLLRLGYEIACEPDLPGVARRPDFRAEGRSGSFVMEATVVGESDQQAASDRREAEVLDVIDRVQTDCFFLSLITHSIGPAAPPAALLRRQLTRWLEHIDPDEVMQAIETEGHTFGPTVPAYVWKDAGWHVTFRPIPIKPEARGKPGLRPIGMRGPGEAYILDETTPLRGAIKDKAGAYGSLGMPYIIAAQMDSFSPDDFPVANALFGHEQVTMRITPDGGIEHASTRAPDGVWFGPAGIQNRRLSAVLFSPYLRPWTVATTVPTLWHHPLAELPAKVDGAPWRIARVDGSGRIGYENPLNPARQFFGLSQDWPGPESAWPSD